MSVEDLERAERADACLELAHQVRNALSCERGLIIEAQSTLGKMLHRCQGTMDGLQALIDQARLEIRLLDPAGTYQIRSDGMGDGAYGAWRRNGAKRYAHRGLDTICTPGDSVRAPMAGAVSRIGWCYAGEDYRLVVLEARCWECRVLYVEPLEGLLGRRVREGEIIGHAQDVTLRDGYAEGGMLPHLHTELYQAEALVDPTPLMGL